MPARLPFSLIQVYTGDGKGKTTAALGQAWRALGAGLRVCFVQFIKGAVPSAEHKLADRFGDSFILRTFASHSSPTIFGGEPSDQDRRAAADAWRFAAETITSGDYDLVVLDEINNALHLGLLDVAAVLDVLASRPSRVEVICTGRNAPGPLLEVADLVTEMREIKHPYHTGTPARKGIEL